MSLPAALQGRLSLPLIGAPMFIVSGPDLVIEQCKAGIVGSFPALNARPPDLLDDWLTRITAELEDHRAAHPGVPVAPFAVNQIVHPSNDRLEHDVSLCVKHKVPIVITSLQAPTKVAGPIHAYGGLIFHDVTNIRHAKKALAEGADGLILVCAGAGGHAGALSPFALVYEVRQFFDGPIILSGAIASGAAILAAQAIGADLAYAGTRFIATVEANADPAYKAMVVESAADDIVYTSLFTGVKGNYLAKSVAAAGLDPADLPEADKSKMNFGGSGAALKEKKTWRDIWGAGQSAGQVHDAPATAEVVARLRAEYDAARRRLMADSAAYGPEHGAAAE
ncbi:MAG: nitronate monooxygenase family protein [Bauldia litoralis]